MEQNTSNGANGKKAPPRFDTLCRIHVHSLRHRLADADGISGKAAIDGLVHFGILEDDKASCVKEVSYSQEKIATSQKESTILTIETVE